LKRLVGIDYGRKRLGIAMTDGLGMTAQGQPTITASGFEDAVKQVLSFVSEHDVASIVVGLPLNMDGSRGEMAEEVRGWDPFQAGPVGSPAKPGS